MTGCPECVVALPSPGLSENDVQRRPYPGRPEGDTDRKGRRVGGGGAAAVNDAAHAFPLWSISCASLSTGFEGGAAYGDHAGFSGRQAVRWMPSACMNKFGPKQVRRAPRWVAFLAQLTAFP